MEDDMYFDDFVFYKLKWEDILKFINKDAIAINLANIQRRFINDLNNKSIKSKV